MVDAEGSTEVLTSQELVGKRVLVGVTRCSSDGELEERFEVHGVVTRCDDVLAIQCTDGSEFTLPPEPQAFSRAEPGAEYRLRSTGETVANVDLVATWTVRRPG